MKRNERSLFNTIRKTVTPETINVEIPEGFTLEARQALHELLTIEKGMYAVAIYWNDIENAYCVHYERPYTETAEAVKAAQEVQTIEAVAADLPRRDMTWTGYPKTTETTEEAEAETTEETTNTTEEAKEEETMFNNYIEAVTADVRDYIRDNFTPEEITEAMTDRDEFRETLNNDMWVADEVTGNGSGSYTFNRSAAREYVLADIDTVREALREFCIEADTIAQKFLDEDWEYFDVTARCYVLDQAIETVLDELEAA